MPTKKEPTRSSAGMRTAVKKAESNQISATRVAAKTHDETKPSSTPASARAKAGHMDPAPAAIGKPTPKQASATQRHTKSVPETKSSSPKPSRTTHVKARPDNASMSDKPAPRANAPAAAPSTGAHPSQPDVIDKAAAPLTRIMADADIGDGNILYLRGEGGGLSWDTGVAMNNDGDNKWSWVVESTDEYITFKFVINDLMWSEGDNLTVAQGKTSVSTPSF